MVWFPPANVNGVLERYIVYASIDLLDEPGDVGYNDTDLFTTYTLENLVPGTTYYIRVSVS